MTWRTLSTPQRIEAIKAVWQPGMSAREIAAELGTTRASIIGMYHRYRDKLADYPLPAPTYDPDGTADKSRRPKAERKPAANTIVAKPSIPRPLTPAEYDATALNLTLLELGRRQCKWAVNSPPPRGVFLFCGHETETGEPYCRHHTERSISRASFVAQAA